MFEHNGFRAVAELKRTAKKEELLLMAAKSDPFYSGKEPGHIKKAVWFGQMFDGNL
jgi:hypothetical protein